jgi:hypothetical protein
MRKRVGFGNVELRRVESVKIPSRHLEVRGDLRHRGFAIAVMLEPPTCGFQDTIAGFCFLIHAKPFRLEMMNNQQNVQFL